METQNNQTGSKIFGLEQELNDFLEKLFSDMKSVEDYDILVHEIYVQSYYR